MGEASAQGEALWTGRSLSAMKKQAQRIESTRAVLAERRRYLVIGAIALIALGMFVSLPGGTAALGLIASSGAIVSSGVFLFALSRFLDRLGERPWDSMQGTYQ